MARGGRRAAHDARRGGAGAIRRPLATASEPANAPDRVAATTGTGVAGAPTVSVVIPTFDRAALLPVAVASALAQRPAPLEVIVVDDGSTDDTPEVCRRFPPPVRTIRQANTGPAAARNRGIRKARGDYVAFLDSDDVWLPGKLAAQLAALTAAPGAGWCVCDCELADASGTPLPGLRGFRDGFPVFRATGKPATAFFATALEPFRFRVAGTWHEGFHGDAFRLLFYGSFVFPTCALVRRDLFDRAGLFDEGFRVAEDNEFFHRLAAVSQCAVITTRLARYRLGAGNTLTSPANTVRLIEAALESARRATRLRPLSEVERAAFAWGEAELERRLAYAHLTRLDRRAARAAAVAVLRRREAPRRWSALGIYGASWLPRFALAGLGALKRRLHGDGRG